MATVTHEAMAKSCVDYAKRPLVKAEYWSRSAMELLLLFGIEILGLTSSQASASLMAISVFFFFLTFYV
jgi:hypothetical protein